MFGLSHPSAATPIYQSYLCGVSNLIDLDCIVTKLCRKLSSCLGLPMRWLCSLQMRLAFGYQQGRLFELSRLPSTTLSAAWSLAELVAFREIICLFAWQAAVSTEARLLQAWHLILLPPSRSNSLGWTCSLFQLLAVPLRVVSMAQACYRWTADTLAAAATCMVWYLLRRSCYDLQLLNCGVTIMHFNQPQRLPAKLLDVAHSFLYF